MIKQKITQYLKKHSNTTYTTIHRFIKYANINTMKLQLFKCTEYNLKTKDKSIIKQFIQRYLNNNTPL